MAIANNQLLPGIRLQSLDAFRGITMFLLTLEATLLYDHLRDLNLSGLPGQLITQFQHHPWHGLRFWDHIQPFFIFIVGVAMPLSYQNRIKKGQSHRSIFIHTLRRAVILLFLGVLLHCGYSNKLVWELWNVLCQLSFTILVAFLIMRLPLTTQLIISFLMILISDLMFRFFWVPGYNQPFVMGHNFGSWMDMVLMGKLSGGGWVAINAVPTSAHTIWGVLAAKVLLSERSQAQKIKILIIAGLSFLVVGYGLDLSGISPVIKRICTASFIFITGGYTILALTLLFYIVDIAGYKKWIKLFLFFGMNSIFIYVFSNTIGYQWLNGFTEIFTRGFMNFFHTGDALINITNSIIVLLIDIYLLYWLYKKKIFFRI
jgi:predicted acyltransferase